MTPLPRWETMHNDQKERYMREQLLRLAELLVDDLTAAARIDDDAFANMSHAYDTAIDLTERIRRFMGHL